MSEAYILVTGGSSGIGKQCVETFLERGFNNIIFTYCRSKDSAIKYSDELKSKFPNAKLLPMQLNLSSGECLSTFIEELKGLKVKLNVLVQNAGVGSATVKNYVANESKQLNNDITSDFALGDTFFRVNAIGPCLLLKYLQQENLLNTENHGSLIIILSSVGGGARAFKEFNPLDLMSKAAVTLLTKHTSLMTVNDPHLHVISYNLGAIDTPMFNSSTLDHLTEQQRSDFLKQLPKGGIISPQAVAREIATLIADPENFKHKHGAIIDFSCGMHNQYADLPVAS